MYGPTETTVWSSIYKVGSDLKEFVPIGRPIANTRFYILDNAQQPVAVGIVGELYIGGEGVALGYLERLELTEEKFVPDPFAPHVGNDTNIGCLVGSENQRPIKLGAFSHALLQPDRNPRRDLLAVLGRADVTLAAFQQAINVECADIGDTKTGIYGYRYKVGKILTGPSITKFVIGLSVLGLASLEHPG